MPSDQGAGHIMSLPTCPATCAQQRVLTVATHVVVNRPGASGGDCCCGVMGGDLDHPQLEKVGIQPGLIPGFLQPHEAVLSGVRFPHSRLRMEEKAACQT
jgi:translation initiation factor 2 gamma subunit (eIF-2gamma)